MGKIVRLTEDDLTQLVKKVMKEQSMVGGFLQQEKPRPQGQMINKIPNDFVIAGGVGMSKIAPYIIKAGSMVKNENDSVIIDNVIEGELFSREGVGPRGVPQKNQIKFNPNEKHRLVYNCKSKRMEVDGSPIESYFDFKNLMNLFETQFCKK